MFIGMRLSDDDLARKTIIKFNDGLESKNPTKMFYNGFAKCYGWDSHLFILIKSKPIMLSPFWFSLITLFAFVYFNIGGYWLIIPILPLLISFAWTRRFIFFMASKGLRKNGYKGFIHYLSKDDIIEGLLNVSR